MSHPIARLVMLLGIAIFLVGSGLYLAERFNIPLGRLPGDIRYESGNFRLYFPITSMVIISIVISFVINLITRFLNH